MEILEIVALLLVLLPFCGGFLYCLFKETISNCKFRKELVAHMKRIELLFDQEKNCASADARSGNFQP